PQPTSRGGGTGNGYPGGPRPDAWREPATFAVRCGWAMAARRLPRLPLANLPTTSSTRPAPTTPPQRASATGRRGREAIGEGDEGPETRRDACLLTAAKTPVRPTPPRTGAAPARSSGRTPPPGGPTPSPHRGFALGTSPSLAASASEPSQEAAEGGRRARPGPACLDDNQPRPGTAGSRPRSGYPSAAAREPAHRGLARRPRRRPPASQPNASDPPSSPYTCLARAPGRPGGPGARSPAAARNTAGRSCSEAGNVLHGRTKRPRGEGQRARVVEKGALPARKANGNGGKRPSAHGLPACRPSSVPSSNPCRQPTVTAGGRRRPGRPTATAMGPPPRPARLPLSQPLARTSRAPSIGLAARPFTHHDREQVLPLLLSHRVEGSEERRRQPVYRLRGQTPLPGEILVNPPPAGPAKCPGNRTVLIRSSPPPPPGGPAKCPGNRTELMDTAPSITNFFPLLL
ncbi:basic proline-rich protein-like, partial [Penaeus indicus]|uniref:basic proline-rich protein-like n=1 Tax=Penaeus indicus TaxID=29960 RepID=UPI00300C6C9E